MSRLLDKDLLVSFYKTMTLMRECEESFVDPILKGEVRCPVHLYSGEEAIATGVCANLNKTDYIFGTHRSHGHYIAKGGNIKRLFAEIFCRETGCSKGRGGSMHLIDPEVGMLGAAPIVGGTISLALGAALAASIKKQNQVSVAFFGDGATGEGALYESMNFASLRKLPMVFVCENNFYSTHMPISEMRDNTNSLADIARPFGLKTYRLDGNNVIEVYNSSKEAIDHCRNGQGPVFMEFLTYRQRGHVGPDDNIQGTHTDIRPKSEIEKWLNNDPISNLETYLLENKIIENKQINSIKSEVLSEVKEAMNFAKNSEKPKKQDLYKYVFK